jgi:hypothetical protein
MLVAIEVHRLDVGAQSNVKDCAAIGSGGERAAAMCLGMPITVSMNLRRRVNYILRFEKTIGTPDQRDGEEFAHRHIEC